MSDVWFKSPRGGQTILIARNAKRYRQGFRISALLRAFFLLLESTLNSASASSRMKQFAADSKLAVRLIGSTCTDELQGDNNLPSHRSIVDERGGAIASASLPGHGILESQWVGKKILANLSATPL